jgi:hypothetical protein
MSKPTKNSFLAALLFGDAAVNLRPNSTEEETRSDRGFADFVKEYKKTGVFNTKIYQKILIDELNVDRNFLSKKFDNVFIPKMDMFDEHCRVLLEYCYLNTIDARNVFQNYTQDKVRLYLNKEKSFDNLDLLDLYNNANPGIQHIFDSWEMFDRFIKEVANNKNRKDSFETEKIFSDLFDGGMPNWRLYETFRKLPEDEQFKIIENIFTLFVMLRERDRMRGLFDGHPKDEPGFNGVFLSISKLYDKMQTGDETDKFIFNQIRRLGMLPQVLDHPEISKKFVKIYEAANPRGPPLRY